MPLRHALDPYAAAQVAQVIDLDKEATPGCYTLRGVPYVAKMAPSGIVLEKAGRRAAPGQMDLFSMPATAAPAAAPQAGATRTKVKNGITYRLNQNSRWERADKPSRSKPRAAAPAAGKGKGKGTGKGGVKPKAKAKPQGLPVVQDAPKSTPPPPATSGAGKRPKFDVMGDRTKLPSGTIFYDDPGATAQQKATMAIRGRDYLLPTEDSGGFKPVQADLKPKTAAGGNRAPKSTKTAPKSSLRPKKAKTPKAAPAEQPTAGGSLVPVGGKLSTVPKPAEQTTSAQGQEGIDQRYASSNPSTADVDGWLNDSIQEYLNPPENVLHAQVLDDAKRSFGVHEAYAMGESHKAYKKIRDRESFAAAMADSNERYVNETRSGKLMTPEDVGLWMNEAELKSAQKRMTSGRTEASRAKAKQEFEKLSAKKEQTLKEAAAIADKMNAKYTAPREQQIQQYLKAYDDRFAAAKAEREKMRSQYAKGSKRAVQQVTEEVLRPIESFDPTDLFEGKKKVKDPSRIYRNAVRSHLIETHQQGGGDVTTLGLQGTPNSPEELKAAYRRAAGQHHPDRGGSREQFEEVRAAYERMADKHFPDMRKSLDPYIVFGRDRYEAVMTSRGMVLRKTAAPGFAVNYR